MSIVIVEPAEAQLKMAKLQLLWRGVEDFITTHGWVGVAERIDLTSLIQ